MNNTLYLSSFIFGILLMSNLFHCYCHKKEFYLLTFIIFTGITTSLLNHKYSHSFFKYSDRFWMILSFLFLLFMIMQKNIYNGIYLLFLSVILYFIKYIIPNKKSHLFCHITITLYLIIFTHFYVKKI